METKVIKLLRIALGWIFLWAFIDKTFGLDFATLSERAWINGGSPTYGFLTNATKGPFAEFYQMLAGNLIVDWLFMLGLLFIGLSFIFNKFIKIFGWLGALMMVLMYTAAFMPPENNPLVDDHIIYALLFVYFALNDNSSPQ
jgi:thiosulfate dehydrogenase [quinone] large subunit